MIKRISISILLLFLSSLAHSAFAQTASITGTIKDSSSGLVPQAEIHANDGAVTPKKIQAFRGDRGFKLRGLGAESRPDPEASRAEMARGSFHPLPIN